MIDEEIIEDVAKIPSIRTEVDNINNTVSSLSKQLVEGFSGEGFSTNKKAIPTSNAWIEGAAAMPFDDSVNMSQKELIVQYTNTGKSNLIKYFISMAWDNSTITKKYYDLLMQGYSHASIVFEDETDKIYYIVLSKNNSIFSNNTINLYFTFIDGYDTFPVDSDIIRPIQNITFYPTNGLYSHMEGEGTIAVGRAQHVQGTYNIIDEVGKYAHIIGNGSDYNLRSNAHTVDWDGNAWFAGDVYTGSLNKKLATEDFVTTKISEIDTTNHLNDYAKIEYVDERVAALVNSAPETLDTLGELAIAF